MRKEAWFALLNSVSHSVSLPVGGRTYLATTNTPSHYPLWLGGYTERRESEPQQTNTPKLAITTLCLSAPISPHVRLRRKNVRECFDYDRLCDKSVNHLSISLTGIRVL